MGGELGSLVAAQLEAESWVGALVGIDVDPPRRRLRKAEFHLLQPSQRERIVEVVTSFNPHVLINLSVWEPDARAGLAHARKFTADATTAIVGAAAECPALESMVVRSGIEVYGRAHGTPTRPTENAPLQPTTEYGRMLANIEKSARDVGRRVGIAVGKLRLAPVLGKHVPSPLGRLLRQPVVPFSMLADSPFTVVEDGDAARAFVAAAANRLDQPLNIVAPHAVTVAQAIVRGKRVPLPLLGPEWVIARQLSNLFGAPIPEHVVELMHRGRLADGAMAREVLGFEAQRTTPEVLDQLFAWPSVVRVGSIREVA
jgi:UDP-glucose 4-epimerase